MMNTEDMLACMLLCTHTHFIRAQPATNPYPSHLCRVSLHLFLLLHSLYRSSILCALSPLSSPSSPFSSSSSSSDAVSPRITLLPLVCSVFNVVSLFYSRLGIFLPESMQRPHS